MHQPHRPKIKYPFHKKTVSDLGVYRSHEKKRLLCILLITTSVMIVEFVGAFLTNSLGLLSDAGHMLTHCLALGISYVAIAIAAQPASKEKTFGYFRVEILAGFFNGLFLLGIASYIFFEAYRRLLNPEPIKETAMLIIAGVGLAVNLISAFILSTADRESLNLKSAFYHMIGDTLSSIAVIIGGLIILYTNRFIIDAVLGLLIAIFITIWAIQLLRESIFIFLEFAPRHIKIETIEKVLKENIKQIKDVHDIHIWTITSGMYALTCHVDIGDKKISESHEILEQINKIVDEKFDIQHTAIQFDACGINCSCPKLE